MYFGDSPFKIENYAVNITAKLWIRIWPDTKVRELVGPRFPNNFPGREPKPTF